MTHASCGLQETDTKHEPWQHFFSTYQWLVFAGLVALGVIFRWTLLDMRPYHHDESLHGMYGRYFYDFPDQSFYRYDPMLHGPMLYNSMRFIYAMFGDSLWAARTPACIMGTLFIFAPFVFRQFFSKLSVLTLTGAVAISPTMVYWSRFLREDPWVISAMLITLFGMTIARGNLKAFLVIIGLTLQWVTKENVFVTLAIVSGYLAFEFAMERLVLRDGHRTLLGRATSYICAHPWATTWALIAGWMVFSWFYGAGFRFPDGIGDGLGKKGYDYWKEHHGMERIQGPFNFHLYVLSWYELPFMAAFLTHAVLFYRRARAEIQLAGACVVAAAALCIFFISDPDAIKTTIPFSFLKLKDFFDLAGAFFLLFHSPLVVIQHLLNRQRSLAITGYFFTATLFVYSYLGEKVPWLTIYPYIFGLPYLALFFESYLAKAASSLRSYPVERVLLWIALSLLLLGNIFVLEASDLSWKKPTVSPEDRLILGFGALLVAAACSSLWGNRLSRLGLGSWTALVGVCSTLALVILQVALSDGDAFWSLSSPSFMILPSSFAALTAVTSAILLILLAYLLQRKPPQTAGFFAAVPRGLCLSIVAFLLFCSVCYVEAYYGTAEDLSPSRASAGAIQAVVILVVIGCLLPTRPSLGRINVLTWLAIIASGYNIRGTIQANFLYAGKETEYISQVHTTYEIAELAKRIVDEVNFQPESYKPNVYVTGDATWPLTWYFRGLRENYKFSVSSSSEKSNFTYLVQDWNDTVKEEEIPEGFYSRKVNLRGWWVPDFKEMTLKKFLRYAINHYPWSPTGFTSVIVSVAKDTDRFKETYTE